MSDLSSRNAGLKFLKIKLQGTKANRDGLGAKVQVTTGGLTQTQVYDGQSGYMSQSAFPLYFGLGTAESVNRIEVTWPGGKVQVLEGNLARNSG
ncbi:MAG: ASPIC/UnbV domain-containing protein [Planctomycetota bacterium]|nr:ASPIC/UnbV domain-containing protein [Planctomycetota bacterium]